MPMDDIYADVDAVGVAEVLENKGIDILTVVGEYYIDKHSDWRDQRFYKFVCLTTIQNGYSLATPYQNFKSVVDFYTHKVDGEEWMLIEHNILKGATLKKEVRDGIRDGFVDFIFKMMNK